MERNDEFQVIVTDFQLTSLPADCIRLPPVQRHLLLNKADNIRADGGLEDGGELDALPRSFSLLIVDGHQGSGNHLTLKNRKIQIKSALHRPNAPIHSSTISNGYQVDCKETILATNHLSAWILTQHGYT